MDAETFLKEAKAFVEGNSCEMFCWNIYVELMKESDLRERYMSFYRYLKILIQLENEELVALGNHVQLIDDTGISEDLSPEQSQEEQFRILTLLDADRDKFKQLMRTGLTELTTKPVRTLFIEFCRRPRKGSLYGALLL